MKEGKTPEISGPERLSFIDAQEIAEDIGDDRLSVSPEGKFVIQTEAGPEVHPAEVFVGDEHLPMKTFLESRLDAIGGDLSTV
ncbi:MAG TPA: hypothetical protein VJK09_00560 [Candidatus Paceibacterota bacterium]